MRSIIIASFICIPFLLVGQKKYTVAPLTDAIEVDGSGADTAWQSVSPTGDFTTTLPQFGKTPQQATEVKMAYDRHGIYILARCQSSQVRRDGAVRDGTGTGDYFSVAFDTWNDDQNAFVFYITAGGQITEQRLGSNYLESNYESPWRARTTSDAAGWTAEIFIPFKSLRYPSKGAQNWGLQLTRFDRSTGEVSNWSPQHPNIGDRVLQFGELSGLEPPLKQLRIGASVLQNTNWLSSSIGIRGSGFDNFDFQPTVGLDARVGFNPATTLDFTVMPIVSLITPNLVLYSEQNYFMSLLRSPTYFYPEQRLLKTEESIISQKSDTYWNNPSLTFSDLSPGLPLAPTENAFTLFTPAPVNHARFTTRTRNNIGIAINNTVFTKPEFYVFDNLFIAFTEKRKYPINPVYNHIAVEKALRNNSWVQVAMGNMIAGKELNTTQFGLSAQLRDRSNHYELSGQINSATRWKSEGAYTRMEGNARIARINSAHTWSLSYFSPKNISEGILLNSIFNNERHRLLGNMNWQNFSPKNPRFLSTEKTVNLYLNWNQDKFLNLQNFASYAWSALDTKFKSVEASLKVIPIIAYETLDFSHIDLEVRASAPIQAQVTRSTDTRKKAVVNYGFELNWVPANWSLKPGLVLAPTFVLGKKCTFKSTNNVRIPTGANYTINDGTLALLFERSLNSSYSTSNSLQFFPSRKWAINLNFGLEQDLVFRRNFYEINSNGLRMDIDYPVPAVSTNTLYNISGEINWYLSPTKRIWVKWGHIYRYNNHHPQSTVSTGTGFGAALPNEYKSSALDIGVICHFFN